MEAPDKIYRTTTYLDNDKGKTLWKVAPVKGAENIEYTQTDAFIDKALDYFNSKLYDWVRIEHPNPSISPNVIIKQDFIEDFKKYMKED